jgi:hypothetical protein
MKEPYIEGVATHGGPEPCVGAREGVGEALAGAHAGRAIEPRNQRSGVPTRTSPGGTSPAAYFTREIPRSPVLLITGRAVRGRPRP